MPYRKYWGKSEREEPRLKWRPYVEHVAAVALATDDLLRRDPVFLSNMSRISGMSASGTHNLIVFAAAMHDIGKLSVLFQLKYPRGWDRVYGTRDRLDYYKKKLYVDGRPMYYHGNHGIEFMGPVKGIACASRHLEDEERAKNLFPILQAAGAHHGLFASTHIGKDVDDLLGDYGSLCEVDSDIPLPLVQQDLRAMAAFYQEVLDLFNPPRVPRLEGYSLGALKIAIAGIISVADWIGSNEKFMDLREDWDLRSFVEAYQSSDLRDSVAGSIRDIQFHRKIHSVGDLSLGKGRSFSNLQRFVGSLDPGLLILEAPTGDGKTEAALLMVRRLFLEQKCSRLVFALPTCATATAMYSRIEGFTRQVLGPGFHCTLAHSSAKHALSHMPKKNEDASLSFAERASRFLRGCVRGIQVYTDQPTRVRDIGTLIGDTKDEFLALWNEEDSSTNGYKWFQSGKRALLSPVSVTTIDQVLMASIRNSKHHFVRSYALSSSVVIIDEVHATDLYMSGILKNLLTILAAIGSRVVLLSATLSPNLRCELLRAYREGIGKDDDFDLHKDGFPLVTWIDDKGDIHQETREARRPTRDIRIEVTTHRWGDGSRPPRAHIDDVRKKAVDLIKSVEDGACVAWVRNTVQDAQDTYDIVSDMNPEWVQDNMLMLLHAGLNKLDRAKVEEKIIHRLGPTGERSPCLVIGTQILDQSIDIDFDRLVRDFTTFDYLVQVVGRCHRHVRDTRPKGLENPTLEVFVPEAFDSPRNDIYRLVYSESHLPLYRTWNWLQKAEILRDPTGVPSLIGSIFSTKKPSNPALLKDYEDDKKSSSVAENRSYAAEITIKDGDIKDWDKYFRYPTRVGIPNRPILFLIPILEEGVYKLPFTGQVLDIRFLSQLINGAWNDKRDIRGFLHNDDTWLPWTRVKESLSEVISGRSTIKESHNIRMSGSQEDDYTHALRLAWWADGCFPKRLIPILVPDEHSSARITRVTIRDGRESETEFLTRYDNRKGLIFVRK